MKDKKGRREFLEKAAVAALALPALLQGGVKTARARSGKPIPVPQNKGKTAIKKIGIEEHWSSKDLDEIGMEWRKRTGSIETMAPQAMPPSFLTSLQRLKDFEETRLRLMDEAGISMQVIALSSPGIQGLTDASKAMDLARKSNDYEAEIIGKHPDRFAGFAALPTQDPKAAADELERTVKKLGFKGAMIQGHTNWQYLDAPQYRVLWERAAALEAPIYLHVSDPLPEVRKMYGGYPELMGAGWAWVVETATHALRIICSGVFEAYPKATLILGHLGESLPYLLGRLDEGYGQTAASSKGKLPKPISYYIRNNLLATTSGGYNPEALICAVKAMGADRVLFAVDYPFVEPKLAVEEVERTPLSDEEREKIYHLNAEKWLKLS
jgi:2,3-dihydroxybenzoate decarboxylase